jgi:hypothetical protein
MLANFIPIPCIYFFYREYLPLLASTNPDAAETSNLRLEDVDHIFSPGRNPVKIANEIQARPNAGLCPVEDVDTDRVRQKDEEEGRAHTLESFLKISKVYSSNCYKDFIVSSFQKELDIKGDSGAANLL